MLPRYTAYSGVTLQRATDKEQLPDIERKEGCDCWEEEGASLNRVTGLCSPFSSNEQKL